MVTMIASSSLSYLQSASPSPSSYVRSSQSSNGFPSVNFHSTPSFHSRKSGKQIQSPFTVKASSTAVFSENISDVLGEVEIFSASGSSVMFRDLWDQEEGVAVVALLRHFGCVCCWELADSLQESKPIFDSAGVKLIAVGIGSPSKARILAERLPFPMDCLYADPDRKAYDVLGLYHGLGRTFFNKASAKVFSRIESLKKSTKNYTIKATPDNLSSVLQQGGMFVFKGKQLVYARKDEGTGDHAPLDDIFEICCKLPVT